MAGTTINQLNLEVKASAAGAAKTLGKLQSELSATKGASQKITDSFKGFSEVMAKAKKVTSSFARTIARIAMYRAIRSLIKTVTSGIREGVQNLVLWEQQFRSVENANHILSELNSNWLLVKNTMGSIAVTILGLILPAVETLTNAFITLVNVVNQFIRALSGETEYAKAVKANYNYAKSLGAVKKQLFGFDELNILNSKNDNGGANLADMFVPEDIAPRISALAEKFKPLLDAISKKVKDLVGWTETHLDTVLTIVGLIGAALIAWKIGSSIYSGIKTVLAGLTAIRVKAAGLKTIEVAIVLVGVAMFLSGIKDALNNGLNEVNSFLISFGALIAGFSAAAILGISLAVGGVVGGIIGLLTILAIAIYKNWDEIKEKWNAFIWKIETGIVGFANRCIENLNLIIDALNAAIKGFNDLTGASIPAIRNIQLISDHYQAKYDYTKTEGLKVTARAEGGTVPAGQLFIANEAGPELVGTVGGKTTVTNQDQFTAGLESANEIVVQAVLAAANAIVGAVNSKDMSVQLDGETVSKKLYKSMRYEGSRQGTPLVEIQY